MKVRVLFFASLRERTGSRERELDLAESASVEGLLAHLHREYPVLAQCGRVSIAVNEEYAPLDHLLREGDEVALIPPVSGG